MDSNIVGKRFGRLVVIEFAKRVRKEYMYLCKCDCGNTTIVRRYSLTSGHTKSCGCYRKDKIDNDIKEMIGKKFGKLLVVGKEIDDNPRRYICKCDCGAVVYAKKYHLKSGRVVSCGCKRHESKILKDITGNRYGKLLALEFKYRENGTTFWKFKCDCGVEKVINSYSVTSGHTKSCGCIHRKPRIEENQLSLNRKVSQVINGAKSRNHKMYLTKTEIEKLVKSNCVYCGAAPEPFNGIDRVDNTKDYFTENCVPCCSICNYAKRGLDVSAFKSWISKCYAFMKEENEKLANIV